ncbi:MAG: PQQ-binding-like beta-propeller repeat protein [Thermoplasmatales archaeon]|nr:PQQ-binding-like beta-propeller repeat protein [Thermoplasmatales archaeon]
MHPSPAVSGNYVYVGSDDRYIYCLDKNTGEFKWKFKTREGVGSSPAVSGNYVYVGSSDGYVYAFTTPTSIVFAPTPLPEVTPMSTLTPGFEAVFAITGLLAVAHLLRRR